MQISCLFVRNCQKISQAECTTLKGMRFNKTGFTLLQDKLGVIKHLPKTRTRGPASASVFFAQVQIFWSKFANSLKRDYCLKSSFRRFSTNINSTSYFYILWKRGYHDFSLKFLSHGTEKLCWGTIQCIRKFRLSKKFFAWEGDITILCRKFLSHSTEKFCWGPFLCFKKILLSKIFMHRRGRGAWWFCPKLFVSQDRKIS